MVSGDGAGAGHRQHRYDGDDDIRIIDHAEGHHGTAFVHAQFDFRMEYLSSAVRLDEGDVEDVADSLEAAQPKLIRIETEGLPFSRKERADGLFPGGLIGRVEYRQRGRGPIRALRRACPFVPRRGPAAVA